MALKKKGSVAPVADEKPVVEQEAPAEETKKPAAKAAVKKKAAAPAPTQDEPLEVVDEPEQEPVQETVQKQEPVRESVSTEVAERATTAVATRPSKTGVLAEAEDAGFGGLDIGFGSFPILKIQNGAFVLDEVQLEGKSIHLVIRQSKSKFLIKQVVGPNEEAEFIYSYDNELDLSGNSVEEWKAEQRRANFEVETKEYAEAVAEILEDNEYNGDFCILSIPPSGRTRFSGYVAQLRVKRGVFPGSVITLATVGKSIKKGPNTWNPWNFKFVEMYEEEE